MRFHRSAMAAVLTLTVGLLAACGESENGGGGDTASKKVALIIAQGGLGDESYNDLAYSGLQKALKDTGLEGSPVESDDVVGQGEQLLRRAAESSGLVIDLEFSHNELLAQVAKDFPDVKFGFLNAEVPGDNVASVVFQEQEGSYLAGALAALMTTQTGNPKINAEKVIGVIGGTKSTGIDKFLVGYIQGAHDIDPEIQVLTSYSENFGDPTKGKQLAESMYDQGADIVFHVAGGTGAGVIEAAKGRNHYAIGVDTDQDELAPGFVLTSMVKHTELAVEQLVGSFADGDFAGGKTINLGLKEDGVGLTDFSQTKADIPQAALDKVEELKQQIISGDVKVWNVITDGYPDWYQG